MYHYYALIVSAESLDLLLMLLLSETENDDFDWGAYLLEGVEIFKGPYLMSSVSNSLDKVFHNFQIMLTIKYVCYSSKINNLDFNHTLLAHVCLSSTYLLIEIFRLITKKMSIFIKIGQIEIRSRQSLIACAIELVK